MTPPWDILLDEALLASILPTEYAHFARPIRDGLSVFLNGLDASDQTEILSAQFKLPATATISQRLGLLARSSPVLQKLGQILARDRRLVPELRLHLRELESLPPTIPLATIQQLVTAEIGRLDQRGMALAPPAIAEASVAVVIPFRYLSRCGADRPAEGVFKLLKPRIEERLERELGLLERVGEHLDERCDELRIPHLDYRATFQTVCDKLRDEVRLDNEQRHLTEARKFFADEPRVHIPHLFDHCTSRVTVMERISGCKVTGHGMNCPHQRRRLARLVAHALIAMPVFSRSQQALFHGDPHAGNLFLTEGGRLAILDWSLVGRLGERPRIAIVQIMLGAVTLDSGRIASGLAQLAERQVERSALRAVVERGLRRIRRGQLPGLRWLVGLLDEATQHARLRVGADLMLFRKAWHTLDGVVAEIGQSHDLTDQVLATEFLRHFTMEWPQRWLCTPFSRDFATRLSNLDLTQAMLSYPTTAAQFWTGHARDMLEARRSIQHYP